MAAANKPRTGVMVCSVLVASIMCPPCSTLFKWLFRFRTQNSAILTYAPSLDCHEQVSTLTLGTWQFGDTLLYQKQVRMSPMESCG